LRTVERVRDEDCGASVHDLAQVVQDFVFSVSVDTWRERHRERGFAGCAEAHARWRPLLLTSGERECRVRPTVVFSSRETFNVLGDISASAAALILSRLASVGAERDIFANGEAEEERFLGNKTMLRRNVSIENSRIGLPSIRTAPGSAS